MIADNAETSSCRPRVETGMYDCPPKKVLPAKFSKPWWLCHLSWAYSYSHNKRNDFIRKATPLCRIFQQVFRWFYGQGCGMGDMWRRWAAYARDCIGHAERHQKSITALGATTDCVECAMLDRFLSTQSLRWTIRGTS